jgi:hypothetical protein
LALIGIAGSRPNLRLPSFLASKRGQLPNGIAWAAGAAFASNSKNLAAIFSLAANRCDELWNRYRFYEVFCKTCFVATASNPPLPYFALPAGRLSAWLSSDPVNSLISL